MLSRLTLRRFPPRQQPTLKATFPRTSFTRPVLFLRHQSNSRVPEQYQTDDYSSIGQDFTRHTLWTFDFFARFVKYSALGLVVLASTTWTAYEATHMYVEKVLLAPETDLEVKKWEWDRERERWSGGEAGGTDSALGFKGAHSVRSAWIAQNWGIGGESNALMNSKAFSGGGATASGALNVIEARLEFAQDFLAIALRHAQERQARLHPDTMTALLARHASVLERMGTRDALFEARAEFERVWEGLRIETDGNERARLALKLGDLNNRLGESEEALVWWGRALQLSRSGSAGVGAPLAIPDAAPSSPSAQRTLAATLVSLSAYYATSGQLKQAQALQESSINLVRSVLPSTSLNAASAPEALHHLFLLHRSSLLGIHLAEVLYGLRSTPSASIAWLRNAAESSERVALTLTGQPFIHPDAPGSRIPHPPSSEKAVLPLYTKSSSMKRPALSLLRDSRRSAAEAWNLIGILTEGNLGAGGPEKALECYERALGWAGVSADRVGNIGEASEGVLEAEWKVLWGNYVRAREMTRTKTS
jgi:tetratricopeptide (TPR) repeat protein